MAGPYFSGQTLDDVMRLVVEEILDRDDQILPSRGPAVELTGVLLEISNPRARLSRTETRGKPFSCVGELCWYLAKRDDLESISHYVPDYRDSADDEVIYGAYGPRLFAWNGLNQLDNVTKLLKRKRDTRQAVVQLFDARDIVTFPALAHYSSCCGETNYTCSPICDPTMCFWACPTTSSASPCSRRSLLELSLSSLALTSMPSGAFTSTVSMRIAPTSSSPKAGSQPISRWPPMPIGDPWPAIGSLLGAESEIRAGRALDSGTWTISMHIGPISSACSKCFNTRKSKMPTISGHCAEEMSSHVYDPFVEKILSEFA